MTNLRPVLLLLTTLLFSCQTTGSQEKRNGSGLAFYLLKAGTEQTPEVNLTEQQLLLQVDDYQCYKTDNNIAIVLEGKKAAEFKRLTAVYAGRTVVITVAGEIAAVPIIREQIHTREIILNCSDQLERNRIFNRMIR